MSSHLCFILILFIRILCVTCKGNSSLTFVIDDTNSMNNEIAEVIRGSHDLLDFVLKTKSSEIEDLILVTFNDPVIKVRANTKSKTEFIRALRRIRVHGGGDCPEYSLGGTIEALKQSRSNSYLYVFTDAYAKDFDRVEEVINLCEQKQSQVIFVLTDKCGQKYNVKGYTVYYTIAKACSGSIIAIDRDEVHLAVDVIKDIVGDKKTIVSIATVQASFFATPVTFTLDEKIEHAIITVSGNRVDFYIRQSNNFHRPPLHIEKLMWTDNFKVAKLVNTNPGKYTVWASTAGHSEISIVVYGKTDLTFEHGFSDFVPKSLADTSKQPIVGKEHCLSISIRDPEHEVNIKTAAVLSIDEKVLMEFPLKEKGIDFYITEHFLPPETAFKVAVRGIIIKTGKPIVRVSKVSVQPRIPDAKIPSVTIKEGSKIEVNYGSSVSLNCEVSAYPEPKIQWYDSDKKLLKSQSSMLAFPYKYVSNLKVNDIKRAKSYICAASNRLRTTRDSIQINIVSPIKRIVTLPDVSKAAYGKELILKCLVNSSYPTETKWYFYGPQDKLSVSADGSELTIKEMEMDLEGQYTCIVVLQDDPKISDIQTTRVKIDDLARPEIRFDSKQITVPEKSKAIISCRITKGTPRPTISWQYIHNNGFINNLNESSEDLIINNVSLNHIGKYVCTAKNDFGNATADIGLEVLKSPEILYNGSSHVHVPYDGRHVFTCRVVAHPSPTIVWKDELGNIVPTPMVSANEYEFTSRLDLQHIRKDGTYSCFAENSVGKSERRRFNVYVKPPWTFDSKLSVLKVKYGEKTKLKCDITSDFPVELNWIVNRSKEFIKSNDKYSLSPDANELVINSMDINLQGTYVCIVRLQADSNMFVEKNIALTINDLAPPKLASSKDIVNQTFIARCVITSGVPRPVVTWKFKGDSGNIKTLEIEGEILTINNIQPQHNGSYQCIGKNPIGTDNATLSLEVKESPKIVTEKTEYRGVVGDKVLVIPCNVTGYPDPTIVWKNNKYETIETGSKYIVKGISNILNLYILNPIENDTGKFICEAHNKVGTAVKTFNISVKTDVAGDLGDIHNIYLLEHESKDIICSMLDSDSNSLRWYKNGYLTNVTGTTYSLMRATVSDDGNYTCRVNTEVGSVSETFIVDVGYKPMFEDDETLISWFGDAEDVVDCNVRAKPAAMVEWFIDGKRTSTKKLEHRIQGWGKYKCKVSNVHGVVDKTVTVTTLGCLIDRTMEDIKNPPFISNTNINVDYDEPIINSNKYMFIDQGQQMKLICHNAGNNTFNFFPDKETIIAECETEDKFISENQTYKYSDLECKEPWVPTLKPTKKNCINLDSTLIEVGFEVPNFEEVYEICYDNKLNLPNFGYLKLSAYNLGNKEKKWPEFSYDAARGIDYCDEESKCCYEKGQLVNAADVNIGPPQFSPFVGFNAISIWKPCEKENRMTWRKIEEAVRSLLLSYNTIQVWSGASRYENVDDRRVPRYLWKVLKVKEDILAVIVHVNTPKPKNEDIKCKKPEESAAELDIGDDPFTYLCSLEEFSKAFSVPIDTFSRGV